MSDTHLPYGRMRDIKRNMKEKKKMRKLLTAGLLSLAIAAPVFAGGSSETAATKTASTPEAAKTVKVWITTGAEDPVYKKLFEKARADLAMPIDDQYFPQDELDSKLQVAPVVGDMPDLIIVDGLQIASYDEAGLIAHLDGLLDKGIVDDLLPSVIGEATYKGHMISVAQFDSGMAMWANKSMLEKVGARIPVSYKDAWTKSEFEDILARLKAQGVCEYPLYIRQNKPTSIYFTYLPVIASFGGDYLDPKTGLATGTLNGPGTLAAYQYMSDLVKKGYIDPTVDYEDGFYGRKENSFSLLGHWKYTQMVQGLGDDAIIVPIPDFGKGVFTCSGSTVMSMTTGVEDHGTKEATLKVIEYALKPESIRIITDYNGAIPSRKSVMDSVDNLKKGGRLYLYREQLEAGISHLRPITPAHMSILSTMGNSIRDIIYGSDVKEVLSQAAKDIDDVITSNGWNN